MEKSCDVSFAEAKTLIRFLNIKIGTNEAYIDILNGTFANYNNVIGTMVTGVFEELNGVDIDDEKDSLILWVNNWGIFKKNAESFLNADISKSSLKSHYRDNEIIVGKRKLEIKPNSRYNYFCEIMFDAKPRSAIGYDDIWERIQGIKDDDGKIGGIERKSVENLIANLNKKLKNKGIKPTLFSQEQPVVYRNY